MARPSVPEITYIINNYSDDALVSAKGQVTVPKPLRECLGRRAGVILDFSEQNGRLVAVKSAPEDPVARVYGFLRPGRGTDEMMRELRGPAHAK